MRHILLILVSITLSYPSLWSDIRNLNPQQKTIMDKTFTKAKSFDYEYTLTAIAWHESYFGKYPLNLADPSAGVFHNSLTTVLNRNNLTQSDWSRSRVAERLITDYDFSFSQALAELKYWENYWKDKGVDRVWSHTVASYNAGFNIKNGQSYLRAIKEKIRILKQLRRTQWHQLEE